MTSLARWSGRRAWPVLPAVLLASALCPAALAACSHTDAFTDTDPPPLTEPFASGQLEQFTFNLADDGLPTWTPEGRTILYSTERWDSPDHDLCLGTLPASGGTARRIC